jgi:amino acid permease
MRLPTAVLAAAGLILGYGIAVASGSRPLGGVVLLLFAVPCVMMWSRRHSPRLTAALAVVGVAAFAFSHVLGSLIGAWPAVLVTATVTFGVYWRWSDSRPGAAEPPRAAA